MLVIPVISVVGYSDSGKTMVVVNLVRVLKGRGYRVAAVKHASHGYAVDAPGKDSQRLWEAGADKVAVAGPRAYTVHARTQAPVSLSDIRAAIDGVDFIVVEGFKKEPGPKVGVFREGAPAGDLASAVEGMIAAVTDHRLDAGVPSFAFDQMEGLADLILDRFGAPRRKE